MLQSLPLTNALNSFKRSERLRDQDLPRLVFGQGDDQTVRYFPDKLPIGVPLEGWR